MKKIAISRHIGGFSLSEKAYKKLLELKNPAAIEYKKYLDELDRHYNDCLLHIDRDDPQLIQIIEELGTRKASSEDREPLSIIEIPDDVKWYIHKRDDGAEYISECHRFWYENEGKTIECFFEEYHK